MRNVMRTAMAIVWLVAGATVLGSCSDGGSSEGSGGGGTGGAAVAADVDDPCTWATAEDFAAAGFTLALTKAEPEAIEVGDTSQPSCLLTFEQGGRTYIAQVSTGPKDRLPLVFEANGDREVTGVGERMIVQSEVDEDGRTTTVTVVLADRSFQTSIGEELADEEAVVAIATTMARTAEAAS